MIIAFIVASIKRILLDKNSYFLEQFTRNSSKIKAGLDLSNHATQSDLKNATGALVHHNLLRKLI